MKAHRVIWRVGLVLSLCFVPLTVSAQSVSPAPPLVIREIKITGDEFVVLQATEDISDLSDYWIGYTGSETVNPGAVVPTQQLPAYELAAGQAVLLTSDGAEICDAVLTTKLSVSLGDTKGTFVVRHLETSGLTSTFITEDSVNWAKPSTTGSTTAALDLRKQGVLVAPLWYHNPTYAQPWVVGDFSDCTLTVSTGMATTTPDTIEWAKTAVEPPAVIEGTEGQTDVTVQVNLNVGLAPPLITELLPNPIGTGNDGTDEYIELYNGNDATFNLSGFTLQTGLSTVHTWVVPQGVTIPPKSFIALYASQTGLSMSNTSGQATLFDPAGAQVAQSDPYDSAPDGQSWALANGAWYWTTKPTPAATNVIAQPIAKPATATKKLTTKTTAVKAATTKKTTVKVTKQTAATASPMNSVAAAATTALHPLVLAAVAIAAIGYGLYEYRHDIANQLAKLRRH